MDKAMRRFAVRVSAVGSVGGLLFGYDLGVVNSALLQLSHHFDLQRPEEKGLVVSILLAGSVLGALFGGVLTDKYGRRAAIIGTSAEITEALSTPLTEKTGSAKTCFVTLSCVQ